jgi:hypothetical protein
MSTTFSLAPSETAELVYYSSCPYDSTMYLSRNDVMNAHGDGPCDQAKRFLKAYAETGDLEFYDSERERLGTFPDYCEDRVFAELAWFDPTGPDRTDSPTLNLSSRVLQALGLFESNDDFSGRVTGDDLKGRILMALALTEDLGQSANTTVRPNGVTLIEPGRPAGYTESKLTVLLELAEQAIVDNVDVQWS